jgi:formate hydrogenlyase subunit 3/multisubunit Na+/H+ antiporter MnhD subunit
VTLGDLLPVLILMLPAAGVVLLFAAPVRQGERIAFATLAIGTALILFAVVRICLTGQALSHDVGGWVPPLGLALRIDGTSAALLMMTAVVLCLVALSTGPVFRSSRPDGDGRFPFAFWTLLLAVWAALNLVFMAQDLFTLFVGLELLTFAAVPLACLAGTADTLRAALRYLLVTLAGSVLYLLGVAVLYARYGALDLAFLADRVQADWPSLFALALMIGGLTIKTALFPFHLWLPPAHAGAPAPASAILSALVIKAPFFIILRLWFELLPEPQSSAGQLLAALGAASILICSLIALQQARLKLLVAYSTVAQVGYLFLVFALATGPDVRAGLAWSGAMLQLASHAFAKAAMFLAAGRISEALGHDRIDDLAGASRAAPASVLAFSLAALSLIGLPPSGGFNAKVMLLSVAVAQGHWWIAITILVGGLLAGAYLFRVIGRAIAPPPLGVIRDRRHHRSEVAALCLAGGALLLGLVPLQPISWLALAMPGAVP